MGLLSGRGVAVLWVVVMVLSGVKKSMAVTTVIKATNSLGNLDLDIQCNDDKGPPITLKPGAFHQWNYSSDKDLACFFQWSGGYHYFELVDHYRDGGINPCSWLIKQDGPCRLSPNGYTYCFQWKA